MSDVLQLAKVSNIEDNIVHGIMYILWIPRASPESQNVCTDCGHHAGLVQRVSLKIQVCYPELVPAKQLIWSLACPCDLFCHKSQPSLIVP